MQSVLDSAPEAVSGPQQQWAGEGAGNQRHNQNRVANGGRVDQQVIGDDTDSHRTDAGTEQVEYTCEQGDELSAHRCRRHFDDQRRTDTKQADPQGSSEPQERQRHPRAGRQ
ncbi:hypothetical protein D3C87_1736390 [compost metagenome]